MNREPVNPDDPQMSAYALGELSVAEAAEFEARLAESPAARRELAEMREVMALLGKGLRDEWETVTARPVLRLLEPVAPLSQAVTGSKVVAGEFRPVTRKVAVAAAVAAVLVVASLLSTRSGHDGGAETALADRSSLERGLAETVASVPMPQLFLAEEISDLSSLDLVVGNEGLVDNIDASYLDAGVIPASFDPSELGASGRSADERIDSYLPPSGFAPFGKTATGAVIERRLGSGQREDVVGGRSSSVLVSGYVTMGGSETHRVPAEFRTVSISGNPVVHEDRDLRLYADLNGLQKELSEVIAGLPEGSHERAGLLRVLERSARVASELKNEISQH